MNYYIFVKDGLILGKGQCKNIAEGVLNIEVDSQIYNDIEKSVSEITGTLSKLSALFND